MAASNQVQTASHAADRRENERAADRREHERFDIDLPGRLFVPAQDEMIDCQLVNLSGGGACIRCDDPPALLTYIVLYIDGFGRFEGVTARYIDDDLAIRFFCKEAESEQLVKDLTRFVSTGERDVTKLRRHKREPGATSGFIVRADGSKARCDILDISKQGLSLKTVVRPPLGEMVSMGRYHGRVVRHHLDGFAIQFLEEASSSDENPEDHIAS